MKKLRAPGSSNPNPIFVTDDEAYTSSRQLQRHLLCENCEARFRTQGETWVLQNGFQGDYSFPLREILLKSSPTRVMSDGLRLYPAAGLSGIDLSQLIYFGLSVFWRAGVCEWRRRNDRIRVDLGPYLEPLRLFLNGDAAFPENMAYGVRVSSQTNILAIAHLPESWQLGGSRLHTFGLPGLTFYLVVGKRFPIGYVKTSTAPAPEGYIGIHPKRDEEELMAMVNRVRRTRDRTGQ
ncbi:MAG TPA: hypothetical protein VKU01_20710 [Bryobacteraceae bacterium]|nr:hypothetical protein [Bryobacteraceae bacterium]